MLKIPVIIITHLTRIVEYLEDPALIINLLLLSMPFNVTDYLIFSLKSLIAFISIAMPNLITLIFIYGF